jgi:anhydro-N-acetylmuramic acid kinase
MSGTSMDGIDAVLVSFGDRNLTIHATHTGHYPQELRAALLAAIREPLDVPLDPTGNLDRRVGECFRDAARAVIEAAHIDKADIVAIGSHGQTLRHQPDAPRPYSLQIGNAGIIARGNGITTVSNFRQADISAGGQGAPLVPPFHQWLFGSAESDRVIVNLGGIANITILRADGSDVLGFDTGPGNGLMDAWIQQNRGEPFDKDGQWATGGSVIPSLLEQLMHDTYFDRAPPKSTGFEYFNLRWLQAFDIRKFDAADVQATLAEFTAATIANAIGTHAQAARDVFVCGGGSHNDELMRRLRQNLPGAALSSTASVGLDPDCVEAAAFAWLAMRTVRGETGNLLSVTGATHKVVLGDIHSA